MSAALANSQATTSFSGRSFAAPCRLAARPSARRLVSVAARVAAPKGVTQPPVQPIAPKPMFGFVETAERWNSRASMIGFFALLLVEAVAGKGILDLLGVATGKGLSIGF